MSHEIRAPKEMTIPEVRAELFEFARVLGSSRLLYLANQLYRRDAVRRTNPVSRPMTRALAEEIRIWADSHEEMTEHEIGEIFGVNQGRVSEALAGFRGDR